MQQFYLPSSLSTLSGLLVIAATRARERKSRVLVKLTIDENAEHIEGGVEHVSKRSERVYREIDFVCNNRAKK